MEKASAQSTKIIRNAKTGELVTVRGVGSLKNSELSIRRGIDLTKPIASQIDRQEQK